MNDEELRQRYRRDFTGEPIKTRPVSPPSPKPEPIEPKPVILPGAPKQQVAKSAPSIKNHRRKKRPLLWLVVLVLVAAGGLGYWKFYMASPVPGSITKSVEFPILYPTKLPGSYKLQKNSFASSKGVIQYKAEDKNGSTLAFTNQQRPATVAFQNTFSQLPSGSIFTVPLGQAATGVPDGIPFGIVSTDKTWLIVSSSSKDLSTSDIKLILQNLKVAK